MFNRQASTPSPAKRSPQKGFLSTGRLRRGKSSSTAEREQAMRDYKISIEYKHLKHHCPGGVYLVPSLDDVRLFHGAIFVRRGAFTNGIFKFTLRCPPKYNSSGTHPTVVFNSFVYNPHVHSPTGEVDLTTAFPVWDPSKHFLVTALTYVKRIFYVKDYGDLTPDQQRRLPNQEALRLFQTDPEGYLRRVHGCVKESQRSMYMNVPGCTMSFTQDRSSHEAMRDAMKERFGGGGKGGDTDEAPGVASREGMLEIIERVVQKEHPEN